MADDHGLLPFEDAVDIVVLRAEGGETVPVGGSTPVDLDNDAEPTDGLLTELLAATVRIRADEGLPPDILAALRETPVPTAFRASPWLDASRGVTVRNGVGWLGGLTVRYSDGTGLRIDLPEPESETDHGTDYDLGLPNDENG